MKPLTFAAVNGKERLPVAVAPRNELLTVPVWDLWLPTVQRRCNTAFEFGLRELARLDKNEVRQHAVPVCITQDVQIRFRLGLGAST
jgi:hypothetical protein